MPNVGEPTYAIDVIEDVGDNPITTDSSATGGTTETLVASASANLVSGDDYWVEAFVNISTDSALVATPQTMQLRIREDSVSGNQLQVIQFRPILVTSIGFPYAIVAKYTAIATGSKTFIMSLQRTGGSAGSANIAAGSGRNGVFRIRHSID